jgi:hypothetical protein
MENSAMTYELFSRSITRRELTLGGLAAAALTVLPARAIVTAAQGESDFTSLGYPELKVTITDTGFEGIPSTTAAGRYLLTVTAQTSTQGSLDEQPPTVAFLSPTPAGMTAADFLQQFGPPPTGSPEAGGGEEGGGEGEGDDQALPPEIYQFKFAGGAMAIPGQDKQAIIDLTPGDWVAWGDDPTVARTPVSFTVTGDFPADAKEPEADITATLVDFAIQIEGSLTAGKHVLKVQNNGAEPHFLELSKGPDSMTVEQVQAVLQGEMSGTPMAGGLSESDLQPIFYSPTQSTGTTAWFDIDIEAGTYLAACFFPTEGTGVPHAMNGMIDVFTVTG